jgi:hypothetical protein
MAHPSLLREATLRDVALCPEHLQTSHSLLHEGSVDKIIYDVKLSIFLGKMAYFTRRPLGLLTVKEKGQLHARLHKLLFDAWRAKELTQDSLGRAIGQSQENAGLYLRGKRAGPLDLDEAAAALAHINSSLADFVSNAPVTPPTPAQLLGRRLEGREDLIPAVRALLDVPETRLPVVLAQIEAGVYAATGRVTGLAGARVGGTMPVPRTKSGQGRRLKAPTRKKPT